jgi:ATP-dependent exoDNAse (exonuclease V) beta subunit
MTIHGAKGLEADVVCVADLGRSRGNGEKPYLLCEDGQLGVCVPQPDGSFSAALDYVELRDRLRASETAEEDRILYVAMTRARKRLVLSGGVDLDRWPAETRSAAPISWLGPALVPDIDARLLAAPVSETDSGVRLVRNATTAVRDARPARTRVPTRAWAARGAAVQTGFPPRELSYSSLSDYSRCGYRYYLERVLRMPALPEGRAADGLSARDRGTLAHALLERLDFSVPRVPSVDDVARMLGLAPSPAEVEELRGLIAGFAASSLCERLAAAGGVRREEPFAFELDGILVNGYFDVIANEGGRALVVDYKSDRVGDADLEAITALEYEAQRRIYGLAALRCGVAGVDVVHCYLERVEEPVSASFDDAAPAEQELRELAARMSAASFPVASAPHREICSGCPGRARLCSWDEQITGRAAQDVMR